MQEHALTLCNVRGQTLAAVLHGDSVERCVVLCHGMLSTKDGNKHISLAHLLSAQGVAALRFDFSGRGASDGSLFDLSFSHEVEDLEAVIRMLVQRGAQKIALFGSSMGAAVALLCAATFPQVVAVATIAGVAHTDDLAQRDNERYAHWLRQGYLDTEAGRIGIGFLHDASRHNVITAVQGYRGKLFVTHGSADDVVPVTHAHDLVAAHSQAKLRIVDGADHVFSNPQQCQSSLDEIALFLSMSLDGV